MEAASSFEAMVRSRAPILTGGIRLRPDAIDPTDLSLYVPQGYGLDGPMLVRPQGALGQELAANRFYGFDPSSFDPFSNAPTTESAGGVVYFQERIEDADLSAILRVLGIRRTLEDFSVVCRSSNDPIRDRYLDQVRIVPSGVASSLFGWRPDPPPAWPAERMSVEVFFRFFISAQRERWNDPNYAFSSRLRGALGGDGDWAKEALAFGLLVENTHYGIYRLWSRPFLVTK